MKKLSLLLALLAIAAFGVAACGGDDEDESASSETTTTQTDSGGGGGSVALSADPNGELAYTESSLSAPAGEITIDFDNPAPVGHDVVVEDAEGQELARTDVISEDTATTSGSFEPGDYTYYCSVAGHREAGMEGTLTVE